MTAVRKMGMPADTAAAHAFLCSEDTGYITGPQLNLSGGEFL
jgi:NAD(P)-dependent dehydrogenase (short-subunit alcohol dehydrogenase family)